MWTETELRNFKHYVETTPKHRLGIAPPSPVLGAYDSKDDTYHGFGRKLTRKDFGRGGVYDFSRRGMAFDAEKTNGSVSKSDMIGLMRHLAKLLGPEDWEQLKDQITENEEGEDSHGLETLPTRKPDWRPNNRVNQLDSKLSRDEALKIAPGLANISVGDNDRLPDNGSHYASHNPVAAMDSRTRSRISDAIEKIAPGIGNIRVGM